LVILETANGDNVAKFALGLPSARWETYAPGPPVFGRRPNTKR